MRPVSQYQPHIDGLRTVAILPVVLFHFGLTAFSGGFVGVDIFFVISGYLITRNILSDVAAGTFSFGRFYERRARRLFPSLFVTTAVTLVLSVLLLPERVVTEALTSVIFTMASMANIFFWGVSGYFDSAALSKPLLHMWSLGVEEQFYLVWPAFLLLTLRWRSSIGTPLLIAGVGTISLIACVLYYRTDPSGAFYLMPFRVFEFAIGALVLWAQQVKTPRWAHEAAMAAGLALVAAAVFTLTEATPFPGFWALMPCLGAALCIYAADAKIVGLLLTNPVSVGIGVISYSLYLVHWPIAAFFDAYTFKSPELLDQVLMLAGALVLATLSYRFVEVPFRRPKNRRLSPAGFGLACAMLAIVTIVSAAYLWERKERTDLVDLAETVISLPLQLLATPAYAQEAGAPIADALLDTIEPDRNQLMRQMNCHAEEDLCGTIDPAKQNVLIVGDSLSVDTLNTLAAAFPELNFVLLRMSGCAPWEQVRKDGKVCTDTNAVREEKIAALPGITYLVIGAAIRDERMEGMKTYIADKVAKGYKVSVMGMATQYTRPAVDVYRRLASAADPLPSLAEFQVPNSYDLDPQARQITEDAGATFIDRKAFFCPTKPCGDYTQDKSQLVIADEIHQTWQASQEFAAYVRATYPDLFTK